eukprot:SAG31_NODE_24270_length_485_cov_1.002591_1_plen_83_part_00
MAKRAIEQLDQELGLKRDAGEALGQISIADLNRYVTDHCEQASSSAGWTNSGLTKCDWQSNPPHFKEHYVPLADFIAVAVEG